MKHLKKKLMAATAMLAISAMMLTSVSYAWFTLSTNPEISGMKASVAANENLEIALDNNYASAEEVDAASRYGGAEEGKTNPQGSATTNPYTWGNLVDLSYAFNTTNNGDKTITLQPVKYTIGAATKDNLENMAAAKFEYPEYGQDGRVSALNELYSVKVSDKADVTVNGGVLFYGIPTYTTEDEDTFVSGVEAPYYAFSATYWIRSNESGTVTLQTKPAKRANDEVTATNSTVNTVEGSGSYIEIPGFGAIADDGELTETQEAIIAYLSNLVIKFVNEPLTTGTQTEVTAVINTGKYDETESSQNLNGYVVTTDGTAKFYLGGVTDGNGANGTSDPIATLIRNEAQKITMYVYIDGETITNADALLTDLTNVGFNIQFQHSGISQMQSNDNNGSGAMTGDDTK